MTEADKIQIRNQSREAYRKAKDDLCHREVQIGQLADNLGEIAKALRGDSPDRMVFPEDADTIRSGNHGITLMGELPTKDQMWFWVDDLVRLRKLVAKLEADLRSVGDWREKSKPDHYRYLWYVANS